MPVTGLPRITGYRIPPHLHEISFANGASYLPKRPLPRVAVDVRLNMNGLGVGRDVCLVELLQGSTLSQSLMQILREEQDSLCSRWASRKCFFKPPSAPPILSDTRGR